MSSSLERDKNGFPFLKFILEQVKCVSRLSFNLSSCLNFNLLSSESMTDSFHGQLNLNSNGVKKDSLCATANLTQNTDEAEH